MKTNLKMLSGIVLLASGIANVGAQEFFKGETAVVGKAQIVYAQVAPGVFMDTRIRPATAAPAKQLWAEVRPGMPMEEVSQSPTTAVKKVAHLTRRDVIENAGCAKQL